MKHYCAQRGCEFETEADEAPERCPGCNNPFRPHPNPEHLTRAASAAAVATGSDDGDNGAASEAAGGGEPGTEAAAGASEGGA